jgi:hypothetical protein
MPQLRKQLHSKSFLPISMNRNPVNMTLYIPVHFNETPRFQPAKVIKNEERETENENYFFC